MKKCMWCEDTNPEHTHYAVVVREGGKLLGRLTPDGTCVNRKIYAAVLSKARAEAIATEITGGGTFVARAVKF